MPRGDGTGPMGVGPMSGRGMGFCAGFQAPGYANPAYGYRCGGGRGRGFRNRFFATGQPFGQRFGAYVPYEPADQKSFLQNQATALENELKQIRDRLSKIEDKE